MENQLGIWQTRLQHWAWNCVRELRGSLLLTWLAAFVGGVLCARCCFLEVFRPAGLAWAALWGTLGLAYVPACLGLMVVWVTTDALMLFPGLVILSALLALRALVPYLSEKPWTAFAALALAKGWVIFLPQLPLEALLDAWDLGFCLALYAAFLLSAKKPVGTSGFMSGQGVCLALSLGVLLSGLPRMGVLDAAGLATSLLLLVCARMGGAAMAGSAGLAAGLALVLSGHGDASLVCVLGASGLTAGALSSLTLAGPCLGLAMGEVTFSLLLTGAAFSSVSWPALIVAVGLYLVCPRSLWDRLRGHLQGAMAPALPQDSAQAGQALRRFADCFAELSTLCGEGSALEEETEEVMPLLQQVVEQACTDCPRRGVCWKTEFSRTSQNLLEAVRVQEDEGRILWEEDLPEELRTNCLRPSYLTDALRRISGSYALRRSMRRELQRSRSLVARQLHGVARVMERLSDEMQWAPIPQGEEARLLRRRIKAAGVPLRALTVSRDAVGRVRVRMVLQACEAGDRACLDKILPILNASLGCPMQWQPCACGSGEQLCRLSFVQARLLQLQSSALQWAANGPCGDACLRLSLGNKGYLLAISDGMGVGEAAARESSRLLKLVEEFYRAGFEEEIIFRTINEMLLLRPGSEMFATLDICLIDLVGARAHFVKQGAAPSFLLREGRCLTVDAPSLPMGIVEEMQPTSRTVDLFPGDVIIMGSDGIVGQEEDFVPLLEDHANLSAERLARSLMQGADDRSDLRPDDRTLIVARISGSVRDRAEELRTRRMLRWKARVS